MTSLSYSISTATLESHEGEPDQITVGTSAPGAGDFEMRVNLADAKTNSQIIRALKAFIRRLEDGRVGASNDTGLV